MLFETKNLTKKFGRLKAVNRASVHLDRGETIGLYGPSGSGKTTFGMMVAGLLDPSAGEMLFRGKPVKMNYKGTIRQKIQILFQHPETSFNPVLALERSMTEPYRRYKLEYTREGMLRYLADYGIYEEHLTRLPSQLSGGELQRAALARILLLEPEIIILDEPTAMLDAITQAQIMEILRRIQREKGTSYILISHNRLLCESMCDRIYGVDSGAFREEQESA